jgi:uncharacterized protein
MSDCLPIEGLDVRHSPIHGHGVFARRRFVAGEFIGNYAGRRVSAEESEAGDWDQELTYLFGLSDGTMIDGAVGGNATRHLNHACEPNCAAFEVDGEDGLLHIHVEALTDIEPGDELFLDYQLNAQPDRPGQYACRCASTRCRGSMLAIEIVE